MSPPEGSGGERPPCVRAAANSLRLGPAAALVLAVLASQAEGRSPTGPVEMPGGEELERLRLEIEALSRRQEELERRSNQPLREAVEDYLEDRGLGGPAWTDRELKPLERSVGRAALAGELSVRYKAWENLLDLDWGSSDRVDFSETAARFWTSYALVGGLELELELRGVLRAEALARDGPSGLFPPPALSPGIDPGILFEHAPELELSRAELRLPGFNLLGRLAHVPTTLVLGRQELAFGEGFLLGSPASGVGLRYDGARVTCETGAGRRVDLFLAKASPLSAHAIATRIDGPVDPASSPDVELAGLRFEAKGVVPDTSLAGYLVSARVGEVTTTDPFHYETYPGLTVHTAGAECTAVLAPSARLRLEAAAQWGEFGTKEIRDSFACEARLDLAGGNLSGSIFAAFATGDRLSTTGVHEGFLPLAQDASGRWDSLGLLSSRNAAAWGLRARFVPSARGPALALEFTQAFADEPDSPDGSGFLMNGGSGGGSRIGEVLSLGVEMPLYGERREGDLGRSFGAGSRRPGGGLRATVSALLPGEFFAPDARDPAIGFSLEFSAAF